MTKQFIKILISSCFILITLLGCSSYVPSITPSIILKQCATRYNCKGANLVRADLAGKDLSKIDFSGASMNRANLSRAILTEANLSGADLSQANLNKAMLIKTKFIGAILIEANLTDSTLEDTNLTGANLSKAMLTRLDLTLATLNGANLSEARMIGVDLKGVNLNGAKLIGTNLAGANLIGSQLRGAEIGIAGGVIETNLRGTILKGADLTGAKLTYVLLQGADVELLTAEDATLINTKLPGALFYKVNLTNLVASTNDDKFKAYNDFRGVSITPVNREQIPKTLELEEALAKGCIFVRDTDKEEVIYCNEIVYQKEIELTKQKINELINQQISE